MNIQFYDIETLSNCFTATFWDTTRKETQFVIHECRNDFQELVDFCLKCEGMIGYNNVGFDYPVLHPFLQNSDSYKDFTGAGLAEEIYKRSQRVLEWNDKPKTREWITPLVPQRDLYLIWHFNNKARSTSLKWLEVCMGYKDVREMSFSHKQKIKTEDIPEILTYNSNDVGATYQFYMDYCRNKIKFRKGLTEKFGVDMMNFSDNKIGEQIFLLGLAKRTGMDIKDLKKGRTFRSSIVVRDILLRNIEFKSPEFQSIHKKFQEMVIKDTRKTENTSVYFDGVRYDFGLGGLHALRGNGVYHNLLDADVSSYYPNLAIANNLRPAHLGNAFCEEYKQLYEDRKKYPKGSDENGGLKLALNGVFGQSNAEWSPFYDPAFTMGITINGQLLLASLCEDITLENAGKVVYVNTDGVSLEVIDKGKLDRIFDDWQKKYSLSLEFDTYRVFAVRDVNNYVAVTVKGKVKEKGDFETEKEIYKDQSMKIVPIAVREYFVNKTPIEQTINDCKDIKLFMMGKRAKTGNLSFRKIEGMDVINQKLPKNMRYYVSRSGGSIVKVLKGLEGKEKLVNTHVGYVVTLFNKWLDKPFGEYGVNKTFYIREAYKLLDGVLNQQSTLF